MARVVSHIDEANEILDANIIRALNAIGMASVGFIKEQMETGYNDEHMTYSSPYIGENEDIPKGRVPTGVTHTAIYDTGNLFNSINYVVNKWSHTVDIGTAVDYGKYVHEGTYKLKGRPFIKDGILNNLKRIKQIANDYLSQGFD